jgi:uncharacterized membrane protein YjgN (DUF898 family)
VIGDLVTSYVRTGAALLVGLLLTWLAASQQIVIDKSSEAVLVALTTMLITFVWYVVVRALEHKWPKLGVLLGIPKRPTYQPPAGAK